VEQPLICVIDDEQWLAADPVGLVFAAREPGTANIDGPL
jgi:hypothetical protein